MKKKVTAHLDSPQGFKNSPAIFGEALASDLNSFHPEEYGCWLLQYVDDLLLAAETKEECWKGIKALLQLLMEAGYRVLKKKAQICKEEVTRSDLAVAVLSSYPHIFNLIIPEA